MGDRPKRTWEDTLAGAYAFGLVTGFFAGLIGGMMIFVGWNL